MKGEEDDDVENDDAEEEDDDVGDDDVEEEDRSQDLGPHFVQACAVEMHVNISQSHFMRKFTGKNAADQTSGPHFVRACAIEMHVNISQKPLYTEIYR